MYLYQVFSFLGTVAVFIAALLISSKHAIKPKVRIWAFIAYICVCIFLASMGILMNDGAGDWLLFQQVFLFFVNIRGIYNARKELRNQKRDPFEVIVPKNFWKDILGDDESLEHDY